MLYFLVLLNPVAFFPLNGQYETKDISHRNNLQGNASSVELAQGPDLNTGGSYQFSGNLNSFIYFSNNGGLDTRYSMTFLAWIYHEQTEGQIFYYDVQKMAFDLCSLKMAVSGQLSAAQTFLI